MVTDRDEIGNCQIILAEIGILAQLVEKIVVAWVAHKMIVQMK